MFPTCKVFPIRTHLKLFILQLKNVNLDKISFEEEKILKKRVFISEKAKKYAIANEIYLSKHFTFYIQGIIFWIVGILSSMKLKLYNPKKHPSVAKHSYFFLLNFYGFYTMFCILSYKLLGSYKLSSADSYLASLGSDYVQGGIEYYKNLLDRNKQIKYLNKRTPYFKNGEFFVKYIPWSDYVPLSIRLKYLSDIFEAQNNNKPYPSKQSYFFYP